MLFCYYILELRVVIWCSLRSLRILKAFNCLEEGFCCFLFKSRLVGRGAQFFLQHLM